MEYTQQNSPADVLSFSFESLYGCDRDGYLIKDIIPQKAIVMFTAPTNVGKSLIATDIAVHIASGQKSWHGLDINARTGKVLKMVDEGFALEKKRLKAAMMNLEVQGIENRIVFSKNTFNLDDAACIRSFISAVKENIDPFPELVIFDTLSGFLPRDENSAHNSTLIRDNLHAICEELDTSILLIHHTGKSTSSKEKRKDGRGSSGLMNMVDVAAYIDRKEESDPSRIAIECQKNRSGKYFKNIELSIGEFEVLPAEGDYPPVVSAAILTEEKAWIQMNKADFDILLRIIIGTGLKYKEEALWFSSDEITSVLKADGFDSNKIANLKRKDASHWLGRLISNDIVEMKDEIISVRSPRIIHALCKGITQVSEAPSESKPSIGR